MKHSESIKKSGRNAKKYYELENIFDNTEREKYTLESIFLLIVHFMNNHTSRQQSMNAYRRSLG